MPKERETKERDGVPWTGGCEHEDRCVLPRGHDGPCKLGAVEDEDYEVEYIVSEHRARKRLTYLVKWRGWPESDNTWEPSQSLVGCDFALRVWSIVRERLLDSELPKAEQRRIRKEAERQVVEEDKEAERVAKEAKKAAEKAERDAQAAEARRQKEEEREAERVAKEAKRAAEKAERDAQAAEARRQKEEESARREAEKAEERARREAEKEAARVRKQAVKEAHRAELEERRKAAVADALRKRKADVMRSSADLAAADGRRGAAAGASPSPPGKARRLPPGPLRPECVARGCGGAGDVEPAQRYMLRCTECGKMWQSYWWVEYLSKQAACGVTGGP